jgi:hypothetical protein
MATKFMTKNEACIEANLLRPYEILYPRAVEAVATALRSRFESGEFRGWKDGDLDEFTYTRRPWHRLERECARRFITTPARALGVLACSPSAGVDEAWRWTWREVSEVSLLGAAETAMAIDVLHFARERGWSKPQKGEVPTARRARRAA